MSETNDKLPSNEEIVDDLVRDLESSCLEESKSGEEGTGLDVESAEEFEDAKEEAEPKTLDDDYIDELELKDKEVSYSEEDKQRLKLQSEALKAEGNALFKNGSYVESLEKYTLALRTCPLAFGKVRSVLYANRAAAKVHLGRKETAIDDCTKAIELEETYVRAYLRRANLYEETDKLDEALADFNKVLEFDRANPEALRASVRLPPMIEERNEKMKEEMMGKLKDLGNTILKPFGLSTNNFQMVQDPNSGGYSISFKS